MTKQPTRLSSFSIPREADTPADEMTVTQASAAGQVIQPLPIVPAEVPQEIISPGVRHRRPKKGDVPRTQVGARIPAPLADRLADYCHYERARQQDVVAEAIEDFLRRQGF
jgi:hypothetical protein